MNVLVTGASRGIGKAIAEYLTEFGYTVYATSRKDADLAQYKHFCAADLSTKDGIEKLGKYITDNKIDVLVNNAGAYINSGIEECNFEEIQGLINLNLVVPMYLISKAAPYMKEKHSGRIINIGSISGIMGEANASLYSASKSGLVGGTKALALELAEYGITVNTINPGWVDTDMGNSSAEEGEFTKDEIVDCIPQRRFVEPKEIAGMVKYLISDEARGVTGQSINICAGLTCGC